MKSRVMHIAVKTFVLRTVAPSWMLSMRVRHRILRWCGVRLLDRPYIQPGVRFLSADVTVGREVLINYGCVLDASWGAIDIGAEVFIAPRVTITTVTHEIGPASRRAGAYRRLPVRIGEGCWIGLNATILPGVTVAPGCVVAAGAVVAADTEPNGLYAGVPARRLRDLSRQGRAQPAHLR